MAGNSVNVNAHPNLVLFGDQFADIGAFNPHGLTPDALMIYLQTRLGGLDDRINLIFEKQQKLEKIRKELMTIQAELERLKTDPNPEVVLNDPTFEAKIEAAIKAIEELDPTIAASMRADLEVQGQILFIKDGGYKTSEIEASKEYINNLVKQLESSAQMEMITLQSLMSSRQTAVQLSTNLISGLAEGPRAIAANIGK